MVYLTIASTERPKICPLHNSLTLAEKNRFHVDEIYHIHFHNHLYFPASKNEFLITKVNMYSSAT